MRSLNFSPNPALDPPLFLVYFHTAMKTESTPFDTASYPVMNCSEMSPYFKALEFFPGCYGEPSTLLEKGASRAPFAAPKGAISEGTPPGKRAPQVAMALARRVGEVLRRLPSTEELEPLFSRLRGVDLILATLAYGLKVRVSELKAVRVRDINFAARCILIAGTPYALPTVLLDDLRDYIHERLCGSEASVTVSRREQRLFSEDDFALFFERVSVYQRELSAGEERGGILTERCINRVFRLLGRFHAKRALKRGAKLASPLDLFDKGPRIVRRGRRGVIDAYYVWRTAYLPAL